MLFFNFLCYLKIYIDTALISKEYQIKSKDTNSPKYVNTSDTDYN